MAYDTIRVTRVDIGLREKLKIPKIAVMAYFGVFFCVLFAHTSQNSRSTMLTSSWAESTIRVRQHAAAFSLVNLAKKMLSPQAGNQFQVRYTYYHIGLACLLQPFWRGNHHETQRQKWSALALLANSTQMLLTTLICSIGKCREIRDTFMEKTAFALPFKAIRRTIIRI